MTTYRPVPDRNKLGDFRGRYYVRVKVDHDSPLGWRWSCFCVIGPGPGSRAEAAGVAALVAHRTGRIVEVHSTRYILQRTGYPGVARAAIEASVEWHPSEVAAYLDAVRAQRNERSARRAFSAQARAGVDVALRDLEDCIRADRRWPQMIAKDAGLSLDEVQAVRRGARLRATLTLSNDVRRHDGREGGGEDDGLDA